MDTNIPTIQDFIDRWQDPSGSERSNAQMFLNELCAVLGM